jgi:hypothetical protein
MGNAPKGRLGHTANVVADSMFIFGGCDKSATLDDLYEFNYRTNILLSLSCLNQCLIYSSVVFSVNEIIMLLIMSFCWIA